MTIKDTIAFKLNYCPQRIYLRLLDQFEESLDSFDKLKYKYEKLTDHYHNLSSEYRVLEYKLREAQKQNVYTKNG